MPNWCDIEVVVSGNSRDVDMFEKSVIEEASGKDQASILRTFCPMPEELFETVSPRRLPHSVVEIANSDPVDAAVMQEKNEEYLRRETELIEKYGAGNWYDWANLNWGVKWSDSSSLVKRGPRSLKYVGSCPWAPPISGIANISKMWPELRITIKWFEGGMGFKGEMVLVNGTQIRLRESDYKGCRGG